MALAVSRESSIERVPQLIRFGFAGGLATFCQLALLAALVSFGLEKSYAHILALLTSAQISFFLNRKVTWIDRRSSDETRASLLGKLVYFNAMIAVSMLVNQFTFMAAAAHIHYLLAGALGILVAASINYIVSDRVVFAVQRG
ncbi:MAG TPA: GtrA family protein [Chloroflexota bacterium]|jgi:putative flippase GtrA|nr:GtrA family protein [Chloroflexota bacterium]